MGNSELVSGKQASKEELALQASIKEAFDSLARKADPQAVIRKLRSEYVSLVLDVSDDGLRRKLRAEYVSAILDIKEKANYFFQTSQNQQTVQAGGETEASALLKKQVRQFVDDLYDLTHRLRGPLGYYPVAVNSKDPIQQQLPAWAAQLEDRYNKLKSADGFDAVFAQELEKRGFNDAQKNEMAGLLEGEFRATLSVLARTQMAMDGFALLFQRAQKLGKPVSEQDLETYFNKDIYGKDIYGKALLDRIKKFGSNTSEEETRKLVQDVFDRIAPRKAGKEAAARLMAVVVESSFAENASALKWQIEAMGGTFKPEPGNAIANLTEYYALLNGKNGIGSASFNKGWDRIRRPDGLYDRLFERQLATPSGPMRPLFDISLVSGMAFAASGKSAYFSSGSFEQAGTQFFDVITGAGSYAPQVGLTVLGNPDVIDFAFKTFRNSPEDFMAIMSGAASNVARVYSNPIGTKFNNILDPGKAGAPQTRFEAASMLMQGIGTLKGNQMLDYLTQTYLDLGYRRGDSYVKMRTLYELVMVGGQYVDNDNLREFINRLGIEGSPWNDPSDAYWKVYDFVTRNPPSMVNSQIDEIYSYVRSMPNTYIYGLDRLYDQLVQRSDASRARAMSGTGGGSGSTIANPNRDQKISSGAGHLALNLETTTGNAAGGFDYSRNLNKDQGTIYNDNQMQHYWAQVNDLRSKQLELASLVFDFVQNTNSTTEKIDYNSSYMGSLRASGFGNLYIIADGSGQSTYDKETGERIGGPGYDHVEVIYSLNGQYYKTMLATERLSAGDLAKLNEKIEGYQAVLEQYQCILPAGDIAVGEYQKRPDFNAGTKIYNGTSSAELISGLQLDAANANVVNSPNFKAGDIVTIMQKIGEQENYYIIKKLEDGNFDAFKATPVKPTDRVGVVIGLQDRSERAAGLFALTPEGGKVGMGAVRVKRKRGEEQEPGRINGVVVMGGVLYYSQDKSDLVGREQGPEQEMNMGPSGAFTSPEKPIGTASVMSDRLFAMALAGEEYGGGQALYEGKSSSFGVGGLVKWGGTGAGIYVVNGQYNYQDKYKAGFISQRLPGYESSSARAEIDLGKGYKLVAYGSAGAKYDRSSAGWETFSKVSEKIKVLEDQIKAATQVQGWEKSPEAASQVKAWSAEIIGIMNELDILNIGDAFGYTSNQYSVGLVIPGKGLSPASEIKFSLAELEGEDGSRQGYITNMTCVKLSRQKDVYLSFTAGVPVYNDEAEGGSAGSGGADEPIKNFGGVKLDLGNVAFGMAGYNMGKSNQALQFSGAWVNKKSGFIQEVGGSTTFMQGGYKNTFTIGNEKLMVYITQGEVQGASQWSVAQRATIPLNTAAMLMFQAEYRNIRSEGLRSNQIGLQAKYTGEDGVGFTADGWVNWARRSKAGGSDYGFNLGFEYVF